MSARKNVANRMAIRETWGKQKSDNLRIRFILGPADCPFPPEIRLDEWTCEELNLNYSESNKPFHLSHSIVNTDIQKKVQLYPGFVFVVYYPIRITHVGILKSAFATNDSVSVQILQGSSGEIITQSKLITVPDTSLSTNGYIYVEVEEFVYPKGFEGIARLYNNSIPLLAEETCLNKAGGIVNYKTFLSDNVDTPKTWIKGSSAVSFKFVIHEMDNLKKEIERMTEFQEKWNISRAKLSKALEEEQSFWKDIIFVNTTDTYRHIPIKLTLFYKWLTDNSNINFKYFLKTDDDVVIDINKIMSSLSSLGSENIWWGKFRRNWVVNRFGKWIDDAYTSSVYPSFACGAANILSQDLIKWMADNSGYLYHYQGEDISVGIWLSALNPTLVDDNNWSCDRSCTDSSYNRAELSVDEIKQAWSFYLKCGNICGCGTA